MTAVALAPAALAVDNLSAPARKPIVRNVSLQLPPGQIHALVGCNGAGKTTLLRACAGLLPVTGRATVSGRAAFVFEGQRFPAVRVRDIVASFGIAADDMAWLDLAHTVRQRADRLSLGQRQRLALAIGLAKDPSVIFLDEPTTGLDPRGVDQLLAQLQVLRKRGKTVVLSSHHLKDVGPHCATVTVLRSGEVTHFGPVTQDRTVDAAFREFA